MKKVLVKVKVLVTREIEIIGLVDEAEYNRCVENGYGMKSVDECDWNTDDTGFDIEELDEDDIDVIAENRGYELIEARKGDKYMHSVSIDKEFADEFRNWLLSLGFEWDSFDEQERYSRVQFGLTHYQLKECLNGTTELKWSYQQYSK